MKKIAIPVTNNNQLENHFGQCHSYQIYTISEDNEIVDVQSLQSGQGCGCKSNIANILNDCGVTLILAGDIGAGAINVLNNSDIQVISGCSGNAQDIIKQFIQGKISDSCASCLQHEHPPHEDGHVCNH